MVDRELGCERKDENGKKSCNGVAVFEGEGRERVMNYRCKKCGYPFTHKRGRDAGKHTFNLGATGDTLRGAIK